MDLYLSFKSEAEAKATLYHIEGAVEASDGIEAVEGYEVANYQNIDTIGIIYEVSGEDAELTPLDGWHVNIRIVDGEDAEALKPFEVYPTTPIRVWG